MTTRYPSALSLSLSIVCLIPQLYFQLNMVRHHVTNKKLKSEVAHIAVASNTCYILWIFWLSIYSISFSKFNPIYCSFYFFSGVWLLMGKTSMYTFYLVKLYRIFSTSSYVYKKSIIITIIIFLNILWFIAFVGITQIVVKVTISISKTPSNYNNIIIYEECSSALGNNAVFFIMQSSVSVIILEIISSIIVLRMYLRKLIPLSITYNEMNIDIDMNIEIEELDVESQPNINRVNSISSLSKLSKEQTIKSKRTAVFFNLAMKITNTLIFIVSTTAATILLNGVAQYFMMIDVTLNTLGIYATFAFGNKVYSYFCHCQHCCYVFCVTLCYCCCAPRTAPKFEITIEADINRHTSNSELVTCTPTSGQNTEIAVSGNGSDFPDTS